MNSYTTLMVLAAITAGLAAGTLVVPLGAQAHASLENGLHLHSIIPD